MRSWTLIREARAGFDREPRPEDDGGWRGSKLPSPEVGNKHSMEIRIWDHHVARSKGFSAYPSGRLMLGRRSASVRPGHACQAMSQGRLVWAVTAHQTNAGGSAQPRADWSARCPGGRKLRKHRQGGEGPLTRPSIARVQEDGTSNIRGNAGTRWGQIDGLWRAVTFDCCWRGRASGTINCCLSSQSKHERREYMSNKSIRSENSWDHTRWYLLGS